MKSICENDTIQIELTDACNHACANCTRFVGHRNPFFLTMDQFGAAIDSLEGFPHMVGVMGGEPLLHKKFSEFCEYALNKFPREQLGIWTGFPGGFEKYREIICKTFGNIFLNDHTRPDIYHHPFLIAAQEVIQNKDDMFMGVDKCFFQNAWSPSINQKGAFFCEIAASLSLLFNGSNGWDVEKNWWKRTPKDYKEQIEEFCPQCGGCLKLKRRPSCPEGGVDDISRGNYDRLKDVSNKIKTGKYKIHDLQTVKDDEMEPLAAYKDMDYRNRIAARYGIYLTLNQNNFNEPHLLKDINNQDSLFFKFKEKYK